MMIAVAANPRASFGRARAPGLPRHNVPSACEQVLESLARGGRMIDAGRITSGGTSRWRPATSWPTPTASGSGRSR
ncbi:hypothetical protein AB4Y72_11615 [Arthrobacter sp. YAF34]|uniref:hypothetical protein n=1 Tax=Arthrobacter sp. YAF34 TaxID=3233083 RepID=UPI003F92A68B